MGQRMRLRDGAFLQSALARDLLLLFYNCRSGKKADAGNSGILRQAVRRSLFSMRA